ncbi:MAG: hypothetical protein COB98_02315 [Flavobacteriaceae bacterium]|nr:MAG: hypothetical protein COB98_02315 [Flavobacteriaceae bacterium]
MFSTIFKHELKYWFKQPTFYVFAAILFAISCFMAAATAGVFDFITASTGSSNIVNSPFGINGIFSGMTIFTLFLLPSIIGVSVYRDYKSEMHTILYSYPFTKGNYLMAKFLSSFLMILIIVAVMGLGLIIGFRLPGTNSEIITGFNGLAYLQTYVVYIIPNMFLFGAIVFGVVTFTRNISAGFITVVLLLFIQGLASGLAGEVENRFIAGLLDPFGGDALNYYTQYWTVAEKNENILPIGSLILYNRLLWTSIAIAIFALVYKKFSFSQNAVTFSFRKVKSERLTKHNFGGITRINLPKVGLDYSVKEQLKAAWRMSQVDFKYIVRSWPFISILIVGLIFILLMAITSGKMFGTSTYPVTWKMLLLPGGGFSLFINLLTFLYAGMLVHRSRIFNINQLIDTTPIKNWTLVLSKFIALIKMQVVMLLVIVIAGVLFQVYKGFYNFELGLYFYELYGLKLVHFVIWAMMALFIQSLVKNPYVGLFILLVISIGIQFVSFAGIEQTIFKYNDAPGYRYSDMNGYGGSVPPYLVYKLYWLLSGAMLLILAGLFWIRGLPHSFKERFAIAGTRFKGITMLSFFGLMVAFFAIGGSIYYENNVTNERKSSKERELSEVTWEKKYKKYEHFLQPRIVDVNVTMDLFPKERNFEASGTYIMVNKTAQAIDTILVNHNNYPSTFEFDRENMLVSEDTVYNFDIYKLDKKLIPGDSITLSFTLKNKKNTLMRKHSPVRSNGTFINSNIFPSLGYSGGGLTDDKVREKYGLSKNDLKPLPSDSTALGNTYIAKDADWVNFEARVSTSEDQIAIAPGYLQSEVVKNGRRYFHYKMDHKILNFYAFNSGRYEVKRDTWKDVKLEIYYHKGHEYNLERMMDGMKASLAYNSENFSPYQHKQARIIEFPRTGGSFAQSFPNTIPFSEEVGFIADIEDGEEGGVDYGFAITVHELAHQWWAHQVIGADVRGATMMSESLSEYVSLKVLEHEHGKSKMRKFLKKALDGYLMSRTMERKRESALAFNDGQGYIHYQKGSLVFYALSDYIGEDKLNGALKKYVEKVKFQKPPYTTSLEMMDYIREVTPDSLQYVIKDMFTSITLYKNRIVDAELTELDNGKWQVDIEFNVSKYRNNEKGRRFYSDNKQDSISYKTEKMRKPMYSVPLRDYIEIGVFGEDDSDDKKEVELYLKKLKITEINNKITLIFDQKPTEVGVDPYNKLIDTDSNDNRRKL